MPLADIHALVAAYADRIALPTADMVERELHATLAALAEARPDRRCLIEVDGSRPLIVLPDIHGRVELVLRVLAHRFVAYGLTRPLLDELCDGGAGLICVGDYVHGEARAYERWVSAYHEYADGYASHANMDAEMAENLAVVRLIAALQRELGTRIACLKGNHENITNETREGNFAFMKFSAEGAMVAAWMERFMPQAIGAAYAWEKSLGLLAVAQPRTLVSHAEPARAFTPDEVNSGCRDAEVVRGFTWTDNDRAEPGSVATMLATFLDPSGSTPPDDSVYIGGHRPVPNRYLTRANGRYVQIHNPDRLQVAVVPPDRRFDPESDIVALVG